MGNYEKPFASARSRGCLLSKAWMWFGGDGGQIEADGPQRRTYDDGGLAVAKMQCQDKRAALHSHAAPRGQKPVHLQHQTAHVLPRRQAGDGACD